MSNKREKTLNKNNQDPEGRQKIDINKIDSKDRMKYEIAEELGLLDKIIESGWKSLSAKETGRIGGIINKRRHEKNKTQ